MAEKPQDVYGTYGSVPTSLPSGGGPVPFSVRANPDDFGANIGAAVENAGNTAQKVSLQAAEVATHFSQMATEAKANDDYANKYAPAAAELRNQYDQLRGQDKIHGYEGYISGLQNLNKQFVSGAVSPYEKHLIGGLINRHVAGEIDGAKRELVESQRAFSDSAAASKIEADSGYAARNYNNPAIVDQVEKSNSAVVELQHIDKGYDPSNPAHQATIEEAQKNVNGQMAVGMIKSALSRGDAMAANNIRASYNDAIPGYQQLAIDKTLHTENMRQIGVNGSTAMKNGLPLPPTLGSPPAHIQAVVADAAQSHGVDPNHALTVAWIESSMGKNVGTRGDIGQTGKGGDLPTQAANMAEELKKSESVATAALGRPAKPWEQYACYQQGAGGGAALLKASMENSKAKAVDILRPLYKNPKDAYSAIVNNGGNATMTAGDYLNFVHKKYEDNATRAMCELPEENKNYNYLNTKLTPEEEENFQNWKAKYTPNDSGDDYDLRGAFKAGVMPDDKTGHWPDTFKKPNHPTFSDQSKFASQFPDKAGKWTSDGVYVPAGNSLGSAILAPHEQGGEVVQPAATPRGNLDNFDAKFPQMMSRAMEIPNIEVRNSVITNLKRDRENLSAAATAYSSTLVTQAQQLAVKPDFTSIDQVPSDLASALLSEHPETMHYLELMADHNLQKSSGGVSKDAKEYGSGMFSLMRDISSNKISTITQLMDHLPKADGTGGDITIAGFDKLKGLLVKDPQSASDAAMQTQAFKVIKRQLSGEDDALGIKDPKGEELFAKAMPKLFKAIEDGQAKSIPAGELFNPDSSNWIGNAVQGLRRSSVQMQMDMMNSIGGGTTDAVAPSSPTTSSKRGFSQIYQEYKNTTDPAKRAALKKEAEDLRIIRRSGPQAPISE